MINRAILTGRLTRDVDLRYTQSGIAVGNFRLAVDRNFRDRNGQRGADFINCVIWRKPAENFANFTHKGSLVGVDGRLQSRSYVNKQGQRVYVTEIVVDNFALLESRAQSQAQAPNPANGPVNQMGGGAPQPNQPNGNPRQSFNPFDKPANGNGPSPRPRGPQTNPQPHSAAPQSAGSAKPNPSAKPGSSNSPKTTGKSGSGHDNPDQDPFANSGNKKINISDDDLPF